MKQSEVDQKILRQKDEFEENYAKYGKDKDWLAREALAARERKGTHDPMKGWITIFPDETVLVDDKYMYSMEEFRDRVKHGEINLDHYNLNDIPKKMQFKAFFYSAMGELKKNDIDVAQQRRKLWKQINGEY